MEESRRALKRYVNVSPLPPRIEKIYSKRRGFRLGGKKHWRIERKIRLSGDEPLIGICVEIGSRTFQSLIIVG